MKKYYMHTIEGKPAFYSKKDGQICYACYFGAIHHNVLATSLRQIRKEQELSNNYRRENKLGIEYDYGYILVYVA